MDLTEVKKKMQGVESLATTLGLEFISTPDPDTLEATMQVTPAVSQPFGFLNGGTSLAIAENVAGVGSYALCPDRVPLGLNVSANHLLPVPMGERVRAKARILHKGHTMHVWNIDIKNKDDETISTARVTNYLIPLQH